MKVTVMYAQSILSDGLKVRLNKMPKVIKNKKLTNEEVIKILKEAIDVINRQETKIVILKDYTKDLIAEIRKLTGCEIISNFTENQRRIRREAKTEAYKEFAEHLKEEWFNHYYSSPDLDFYEFVDKFLKETLGEEE